MSFAISDAALQFMEGTVGADILVGDARNSHVSGLGGNDTLDGGTGIDTLDGGSGTDVARYATSTAAVLVDLLAGAVITAGQSTPTGTLISIESAQAGSGNDTLLGNDVANAFYGNAGDDTFDGRGATDYFDGGSGSDTVLYSANTTSVRVDLVAGRVTFPAQSFPAETVISIENAQTGSGSDVLIGNSASNRLYGNGGNQTPQRWRRFRFPLRR